MRALLPATITRARTARRFFLYDDRRIQKVGFVPDLITLFGLPADRVIVRSDAHYCSKLSIVERSDSFPLP
jgi:hypothetical protein